MYPSDTVAALDRSAKRDWDSALNIEQARRRAIFRGYIDHKHHLRPRSLCLRNRSEWGKRGPIRHMVVSRDGTVCARERAKYRREKERKKTKFCLCFWLMIIYNMTSMNQDKYFRGFDICMYLFLFFSLIKIVMYIRCTSIKLLASNHLNVIYHGRDKLLWRTVSSQILDRWFPVLLWTILIRTIDRWR